MKHLINILFLIIPFLSISQTCIVCDTLVLDGSAFPTGLQYAWTCSDGQTSSLQVDTILISDDISCTLVVTDTVTGCVATSTLTAENCDECNLIVNVSLSGTIYLAGIQNCQGEPSYQWQKWNGTIWVNVGTNSQTYNTSGVEGLYKLIVTCSFGCSGEAEIEYSNPCNITVNVFAITSDGNTLIWNTVGCTGTINTTIYEESSPGVFDSIGIVSHTSTNGAFPMTPVPAGNYKVTSKCNGGCEASRTFNYNPCSSFNFELVPQPTNAPCVGSTVTFETYTIPNPPITYVWKRDGTTIGTADSVNVTFASTTPTVISLTVTNSLGCTAVRSVTMYPFNCCPLTVSISPLGSSVCANQNKVFTATATGSPPYSYSWTSKLGSNPVVSQGSGNPKTLNFSVAGVYTITVGVTDNDGCYSTAATTLTVTSCVDCACTPSLIQSGCTLQGSFVGSGCSGYTYFLEYSLTGSSWSTIQTGSVTSFTYTPNANGLYRMRITKSGCVEQITPIINITCYVAPCAGAPTLNLASSGIISCIYEPITLTGNTFGGSATSVTITENGFGSVSPTSSGSSPFSFTYTPASGDLGTNITVTVTTNNPNGYPCIPATATYTIQYPITPSPSFTSSDAPMCVNTTRNITYTPGGGTLIVLSGPGVLTGNVLTGTSVGTIILRYRVSNGPCLATVYDTIPVINNICTSEFSFTDTGVNYYVPNCYYIPRVSPQQLGAVTNKVRFVPQVCVSTNLGAYEFDWGDGTVREGYLYEENFKTYGSNGVRTITYSKEINGNTLEQEVYVNANGTTEPNIPLAFIEPNCEDGTVPLLYKYAAGCNNIELFVNYLFRTRNYTPTYTSHYVKINGVNYTVPIDFATTGSTTTWFIFNETTGIPLSLDSGINTIEVGLIFNGITVTNTGYFYYCNSTCEEDDCNDLEYTFVVDPVAPAPESYIFDRDISSDPVLDESVPSCAPYDAYILGGTGNTWDITITASEDVTWSYSHYNNTLAPNLTEVSRTANSIRFHVLGASISCGGCGAIPPVTPVCGVTIVNAMMRLTGTDDCGNVIFDRILLKYNNN